MREMSSAREGLKALEIINTFLLQQSRDCSDEMKKLTSIKNTMQMIYSESLKQSDISNFLRYNNKI